jgi:N-acetylglucosaminyl-diphospho-decaprenol L-rhamnosyltransferase
MPRDSSSAYSILVVSYECAGFLEGLVSSMNEHLDGSQELVVVDSASSDDPESAVRRWKGETVFVGLDRNVGFGAANNVGVRRARGETIVMLNPDTELLDSSLDSLAAAAAETRGLAGPRVFNRDGSVQPSASGPEVGAWPWVRALLPGPISPKAILGRTEPYRLESSARVSWLTGACVAGRREDLIALGPFDSALYMYGEDLDLGLRAEQAGITSWFCPDRARIVHFAGGSSTVAYGSAHAWRRDGALNYRAALQRRYGKRAEARARWALLINLGVRLALKSALGRAVERDRASWKAIRNATQVPELPPLARWEPEPGPLDRPGPRGPRDPLGR